MSSQLTTLVPMLTGPNYQDWAKAMKHFLQSQGQWSCTKEGASVPTKKEGEENVPINQEDWDEKCEKVMGNMLLRIHPSIGHQMTADDPSSLWAALKKKYGAPGVTSAFVEFKSIMDTQIPNNADPSPALDIILSHSIRLREMEFPIEEKILAMILLSKAPPSMEAIVQLFTTISSIDKVKGKSVAEESKLTTEKVVLMMKNSWETHGRYGNKGRGNQQQAHKLSAVKPADHLPPQFHQQQQQQQRGQNNFRGGRGAKRGKRGGRKNAQQQLQQAVVQANDGLAGPSQSPPSQWVPAHNFASGSA